MPRTKRPVEGGMIYHVLNRGNDRKQIFYKPSDYLAFILLLVEGLKHAEVEVFAFCLMPNHWHLVLRPKGEKDLSKYLAWVTNTHAKRYREHYHTRGHGHVYQGRFKSFVVEEDFHLLVVLRYVEGNALRASLVKRAEDWMWGSLFAGYLAQSAGLLSPWPVERPKDWIEIVNTLPPLADLQRLRQSIARGLPFGGDAWVRRTAPRLGIQIPPRRVGRQFKVP
jgi:putative transposase